MGNRFQEKNGAHFSKDRKYRYCLWRIWDESKPMIMFIGLNPSVANETSNDQTVSRVINFATDWGYGGVYMMNLFAWVATNPNELKKCKNPIGENDKWLKEISGKCERTIFVWGGFTYAKERSEQVVKRFLKGEALKINMDGSPHHPLYLKRDTIPIPYQNRDNK